jgi:hypothetical protein
MAKREKEPLVFRRKSSPLIYGGMLIPVNAASVDFMFSLKEGAETVVEIKNVRNLQALKAYWAMLRDCVEATGCAANVDVLHNDVKTGLGYVDHVVSTVTEGKTVIRSYPISIALTAMDEKDFRKYFRAAEQHLAEHFGYGG